MAYGETNTSDSGAADGEVTYTYAPKTAQQNEWVRGLDGEDRLYREDAERARLAGVTGVDKIDYAEALANYESRSDVELFANRRAREYADTFAAQDFARAAAQEAGPFQSSTLGSTTVAEGDTAESTTDTPANPGAGDEANAPGSVVT